MNDLINSYINDLVNNCLQTPRYANLQGEQLQKARLELEDRFNRVILSIIIDEMSDEQVSQIYNLDPNSPEMSAKMQEIASQIPNLSQDIEKNLNAEVEKIKSNTPQL